MKPAQKRSFWQAGIVGFTLVVGFAACGGLDGRKVTRGPDEPIGGSRRAVKASGATSGNGAGGSEAGQTGVDHNPFGGDTFTGGAPPVVDGPPEVLDVSPADAAAKVDPTGSVALKFSEGLDEATVTSDNIQILDGGDWSRVSWPTPASCRRSRPRGASRCWPRTTCRSRTASRIPLVIL